MTNTTHTPVASHRSNTTRPWTLKDALVLAAKVAVFPLVLPFLVVLAFAEVYRPAR